MSLGLRIRKARQRAGYTQRGLAAMLGVAHSTLGHWENNRSAPNVHLLLAIARATGVEVLRLLEENPQGPPRPDVAPRAPGLRSKRGPSP